MDTSDVCWDDECASLYIYLYLLVENFVGYIILSPIVYESNNNHLIYYSGN